jgi:hypothetical protein
MEPQDPTVTGLYQNLDNLARILTTYFLNIHFIWSQ